MARKSNAALAPKDEDQNDLPPAGASTEEASPPIRMNNEVLPNVKSSATTITGCSESEVKNFMATLDFVCRQVGVQAADLWKEICMTAKKNSDNGDKAAKVSLSIKVDIDHKNLQMMDTKVKMGFAKKFTASAETQEDLRQVSFDLR
jgi:hypothetical protein